jgi:cytochrome P450
MGQTVPNDADPEFAGFLLPPGPKSPKLLQGLCFGFFRRRTLLRLTRRHGGAYTINIPVYGRAVMIADPDLAKQVFFANTEALGNSQPNLSRLLGPGSVFGLDGAEHRRRRTLLSPPFHGKSVRNYETVIIEETLRETASWPEGQPIETVASMMRITLNVILRTIFGAEGVALDQLRTVIPPFVSLGSKLGLFPMPSRTYGRFTPWGRLAQLRAKYEIAVDHLIETALADPNLEGRTDVLSTLVRSRYDDGSPMTRRELSDELLTLIAAGHETTSATLAWTFERISRHPRLLADLQAEATSEETQLRRATIREVQRSRTVIDVIGRHVYAQVFALGRWRLPYGTPVIIAISQIHQDRAAFANPDRFDPKRFIDGTFPAAWIPFGGGTRRCVGSAFADLEMDVTLRTVLRQFKIETTTAPDEKWHTRGVTFTPKSGGRVTVHRLVPAATTGAISLESAGHPGTVVHTRGPVAE